MVTYFFQLCSYCCKSKTLYFGYFFGNKQVWISSCYIEVSSNFKVQTSIFLTILLSELSENSEIMLTMMIILFMFKVYSGEFYAGKERLKKHFLLVGFLTLWVTSNYKLHLTSLPKHIQKLFFFFLIKFQIVRPGGMERPTDSFKETHNLTLSLEDTLFGGLVSNLQVLFKSPIEFFIYVFESLHFLI